MMSKKSHKGFTLIELIVVIAITSILMTVLFQFFDFNFKSFKKGDAVSQVQFDVRISSDYIADEIRNINALALRDSSAAKSLSGATTLDSALLNSKYSNIQALTYTLVKENDRYLIEFKITGNSSDGENPYELLSSVLLNNIDDLDIKYATVLNVSYNTLDFLK